MLCNDLNYTVHPDKIVPGSCLTVVSGPVDFTHMCQNYITGTTAYLYVGLSLREATLNSIG